jgi:Uma2 family endonuclease
LILEVFSDQDRSVSMLTHPLTGPFTWDDIADEPVDNVRREIIGGTLIVSPSPVNRHQLVSSRLGRVVEDQIGPDLVVLHAPCDWRYDDTNVVQPDLLVMRIEDLDLESTPRAPRMPVLVVEVLAPSNPGYDRLLKRDLYERLGVPGYWIVDPGAPDRAPSIEALALVDGAYVVESEAAGEQALEVSRPVALAVTPADLLARGGPAG